ncbi:hypothetical protein ACMG4P_09520 [Pseudovibrio denitrificans]|uniref:hypothetical protein n=1 Tax=Pseudovibrio denitrificans TaxID=258256 RepID=UPI0039BF7E89
MKLSEFRERFDAFHRQRDPDVALKIFASLAPGIRLNARKFDAGYSVFRSVPWPELPLTQNKLSYPPTQFARLGRCNAEGEQVFYASHHPSNTFAEQKDLKVGDRFAIGRWTIKQDVFVVLIGFTEHEEQSLIKPVHEKLHNSISKHAHARFRKYFKSKGPDYYPQTSSIARFLMRTRYPGTLSAELEGNETPLAYASVEYPNNEILAVNFAIPKSFVDIHMELTTAEYIEVSSISKDQVNYKVLYATDRISGNGELCWIEQREWALKRGEEIQLAISRGDLTWKAIDPKSGQTIEGIPVNETIHFSE